MEKQIPFNRPTVVGRELEYVADAINAGHTSAGGPYTKKVEALLGESLNAAGILLTSSCTDALEMAAMLLEIQPGDIVILPSFTFSSTATAFARQGAKLRFCDIRRSDLSLDVEQVENLMDENVKAIVPVHYAGVAGDMQKLMDISARFQVPLIEDNAHGLFATYKGKQLGTFGTLSALSFHETKNFICGEGGALVINDPFLIDSAHILLDKGTNRRSFLNGFADKYTWHGHGSSFGLSDMLAAFLFGQLEQAHIILSRRRKAHIRYRTLLEPYTEELQIALPYENKDDQPADHMFYIFLQDRPTRTQVINLMRDDGIYPTFHYVPLHSAPAAARFQDAPRDCPVTDEISGRLLRLPFYTDISADEQERVVSSLVSALQAVSSAPKR